MVEQFLVDLHDDCGDGPRGQSPRESFATMKGAR